MSIKLKWIAAILFTLGFIGCMGWVGFVIIHNPKNPDETKDTSGIVGGILVGSALVTLVWWGISHSRPKQSRLLDADAIEFMKQYSRDI